MKKNNLNFKKITIKGMPYTIFAREQINDGEALGNINFCTKVINISKDNYHVDHTIWHELLHGFFHECGLRDWASNEALIDWFAHNIKEIVSVFLDIKKSKLYEELANAEYMFTME